MSRSDIPGAYFLAGLSGSHEGLVPGLKSFCSILRPAPACNPTQLSGTCHTSKRIAIRSADAAPTLIKVLVATAAEATNARPVGSCMLQGRLPERRFDMLTASRNFKHSDFPTLSRTGRKIFEVLHKVTQDRITSACGANEAVCPSHNECDLAVKNGLQG